MCGDALLLAAGGLAEVDPIEHEFAQARHRAARLLALHDVAGPLRGLDQVVHEPVDPLAAGLAQDRDLLLRQVALVEHARPQRIVDVVVDVGHPVHQPHDPALERGGQLRAGVAQDPVAHRLGEVQAAAVALEHLDDAQGVLVVAEAAPEARLERAVERLLPRVPERRVPEVVAEADRLGEVLVQPQRPCDGARDAAGLDRVSEPRAVVVALGGDEDLRLVLQPAEALRVRDPVAVALERGPQAAGRLLARAVRRVGEGRQRGQPLGLLGADAGLEGSRDVPLDEGRIQICGVGLHVNDCVRRSGDSGTVAAVTLVVMHETEVVEQAANELYGLPPADFTSARDQLARRLRRDGLREEADAVKGLHKPNAVAWALNQLARRRPRDVERLLATGKRLRTAQEALLGGGDTLRSQACIRRGA